MSEISERVLEAFLDRRSAQGGSGTSYFREQIRGYRDATDGEALYLHGNIIAWHADSQTVKDLTSRPELLRPYEPLSRNIAITMAGYNTLTTRNRLNDLIDAWTWRTHGIGMGLHHLPPEAHPGHLYTEAGNAKINGRIIDPGAYYFLKAQQRDTEDPERAFQAIRDDIRVGRITIERWYARQDDYLFRYDSPKRGNIKRGERALKKLVSYYKSLYHEDRNFGYEGEVCFLKQPFYLFPSVVMNTGIRKRYLRIIKGELNPADYLSQMLLSM